MNFKKDEIIMLLGAGASADAGIPVSSQMVEKIENYISKNGNWQKFRDIYYLIKSSVEYSAGLKGEKSIFNVEILMNILNELIRKVDHPLYPFIGSWNIRFNEIIRDNFTLLEEFRDKIFEELKKWVQPRNLGDANYLDRIIDFQRGINSPLRIFSLNYDLLIEKKLNDSNFIVERGFNDENKEWDYKRFVELPVDPDIYLYKLHGSIDWERNPDTQIVRCLDSTPDIPDLIFGTQYKLQYVDPYLFLFSEFRHYTLRAKLLICAGYSFSDEHVNAIISQAIKVDETKKIFSILINNSKEKIRDILKMKKDNDENLLIEDKTFKEFLEEKNNLIKYFANFVKENGSKSII
jgi:hypothetical protein